MLNSKPSGLELLSKFCRARSSLYEKLSKRTSQFSAQTGDVSLHSLFDVFEFLYMLRVAGINSGDRVAALAQAHNIECSRLLNSNPSDLAQIGLNKTKIKDSMFSERTIKKLKYNYDSSEAIDQSDVSRFLFKHMSRETARKAIIVFGQANLLSRIDAGDSVIIKSNGEAETMFEQYLFDLMGIE